MMHCIINKVTISHLKLYCDMKFFASLLRAKFVITNFLLAISFLFVNNVFGQATVTSDYQDYPPLSTATFYGTGFLPNETVTLRVKNLFQPCHTVNPDSSYLPWNVIADGNGEFTTTWTVCNCPNDSLRLKATGDTSGYIAYLYFKDDPSNGDYRTVANNSWTQNNTWERFDGTNWVATNVFPGQGAGAGNVLIRHNITLNTSNTLANTIGSLTIGEAGSGSLVIGDNNTDRTLFISGDITINSGRSLITGGNGGNVLSIKGNLINNGTFDANIASATMNVQFTGAANQSINGTGTTTDFNLITVNNTGITNNNIIEISSSSFTAAAGFLTLTDGILKMSGSYTFSNTFFNGIGYSIPAGTGIWLNNSNVTVTAQSGTPGLIGSIQVTSGSYNIGTTSLNALVYGAGSSLLLDGGTMTISGGLQSGGGGAINYNQSGGVLTVANVGNTSASDPSFDISSSSSFTMSGGVIILKNENTGAVSPRDYRNLALTFSITGGSVQFGTSTTVGSPSFVVSNIAVTPNIAPSISIVKATISTSVIIEGSIEIRGNVAIESGTTLDATNQQIFIRGNLSPPGNWINNGTFTPGTGTVTFLGGAQTIGLSSSSSTSFNNLTLIGASDKTLGTDITVGGALSLSTANLNLNGKTLNITGNSISVTGTKTIYSTGNGIVYFPNGSPATTVSGIGIPLLGFGNTVTVQVAKGLNFGATISTINGTLELNQFASINTNGPTYANGSTLHYKNATFSFGNGAEWNALSGPGFPHHVIIDNSGVQLAAANRAIAGNLSLINDGSITGQFFNSITVPGNVLINQNSAITMGFGAGADFYVGGNWTNNNSNISAGFKTNGGNAVLRFYGANNSAINVPTSAAQQFERLSIEKTGSATTTLNNNIQVNTNLALASILTTAGSNVVTMQQNATVTRTTGHINGNLGLAFANSVLTRTYDIGDATNYTPVSITMGSVTTPSHLVVRTDQGDHPSIATSELDPANSVNRRWTVTNNGVVFTNAAVTFNYINGSPVDLDPGATVATFRVGKYDGSTWTYPNVVGTPTNTTTLANGITGFSSFAVAACDPPSITLQPINRTKCVGDSVKFRVDVTGQGIGSYDYKWYKENGVTDILLTGGDYSQVDGSGTSTLTISNLDASDIATYYVIVERPCGGSVTSNNFTLSLDQTAPVLVDVPANTTIGCSDPLPSVPTVTATDNFDPAPVVSYLGQSSSQGANPANSNFYNYTVTRTWKATDACGNSSTQSQVITVQDLTAPIITCPINTTVNCQDNNTSANTGVASATDNYADPDNITITELETSTQGANPALAGYYNYTITRTWKATDPSGNSSTCVQTITVQDVTAPVITCPSNATVNCQDNNTSTATGTATATDNCATGNVTITQSETSTQGANPANSNYYNYTTTKTWKATDPSGNSSTCVQTITVQDITAPIITCPGNTTVSCQDDNTSGATGTATATDNCATGNVTITQSETSTQGANPANSNYYNYTITRTWKATDPSGNSSTCVQTITVQDVTAPVITCPSNATVNCQDNNSSAATGVATATDNCATGNVTITQSETSTQGANPANSNYYNYTITRTWKATDPSGNSSTCVQTITVQDVTAPVITCPTAITINCNASSYPSNTGTATATDNCTPVANITISKTDVSTQGGNPALSSYYNYTITRTWKATDPSGNSSTCVQLITVQDITAPIITCPGNTTVNCQDNNTSGATGTATATDNCATGNVTITQSETSTKGAEDATSNY